MEQHWYTLKNPGQLDSPALIIYPDRVKANINKLITMAGGAERLRPHVKTHKTKEATLLMMAAGITKFKCATIAEAEMLGMCDVADALLAYQPNGPKLERFIALTKQYPSTRFSCLIDNMGTAVEIAEDASLNGLTAPVYIDLNVGMNRTGIKADQGAVELYEQASSIAGIKVMGFHAYDGHIHETDMDKRSRLCEAIFEQVNSVVQHLKESGHKNLNIIMGGSPSFPIYAKKKNIECSPGTFVFWDKGYQDTLPEQDFLPAALVLTRVISMPDETKICLDLGHKSIAAENDLQHRVYFLNAPNLKVISQSEEHLVLEAGKTHQWKIGDVFYALPIHICPTCALYESATLIEGGVLSGTWKIMARDKKITI